MLNLRGMREKIVAMVKRMDVERIDVSQFELNKFHHEEKK